MNESENYKFLSQNISNLKGVGKNLEDHLIFGSSQVDIDFFNSNVGSMWKYILQNHG